MDGTTAMASARQLTELLRHGEVGSEELTRFYIDRIERFDGDLNAVVVRDFDRALEAAREADALRGRGEKLGPLHGLPMTVKESHALEGQPSTWGLPDFAEDRAAADGAVVERLRAAGAVLLGKTNVPSMLADFQSFNPVYGVTNNPWDTSRAPGGSSGGAAAALAAGLTALEVGSDIGGSIRNPAHYCGVYGHKPTHGIVPLRGHQPPGTPLSAQGVDLAVAGPLARDAEDLALALDVLAGPDLFERRGWRLDLPAPRRVSLDGLRVAIWADEEMAPVSNEIAGRVHRVAEVTSRKGATVSDSARPDLSPQGSHEIYLRLLNAVTQGPNDESTYFDWFLQHSRRGGLRLAWERFFQDWDVLVCPISATPAFPHDHTPDLAARVIDVDGQEQPMFRQLFWAGLTTVAGLPSTVFPTGLSESGLPIGLQVVGAAFDDRTTIEFARCMADEIGGLRPPPALCADADGEN